MYRWKSRPRNDTLGGAVCRPTATHVWDNVKAELAKPTDTPDVPLDDAAILDSKSPPRILFLGMLFANGWFLKPNFFIYKTGKESRSDLMKRMRTAQLRLLFFMVAWIAAFALLPIWIPAVALVGWIAMVAPQINMLKKMRQNVAPDEEPD